MAKNIKGDLKLAKKKVEAFAKEIMASPKPKIPIIMTIKQVY